MNWYDENLKIYRDNQNTMAYAIKMAREEGFKEGIEQGMKEAIEQGRQEVRIEIAKKAKMNGIDIDVIAKSTGLSQGQIEQL